MTVQTSTFSARIGDAGRTCTTALSDSNGLVSLTGSTVRFQAKFGTNVIEGDAVPNADQNTHKGEVTYTLTLTNLATPEPGVYEVTWQVTWDAAHVLTFPDPGTDFLEISEQLA